MNSVFVFIAWAGTRVLHRVRCGFALRRQRRPCCWLWESRWALHMMNRHQPFWKCLEKWVMGRWKRNIARSRKGWNGRRARWLDNHLFEKSVVGLVADNMRKTPKTLSKTLGTVCSDAHHSSLSQNFPCHDHIVSQQWNLSETLWAFNNKLNCGGLIQNAL